MVSRFLGEPQVAPISADEYSSGEESYMTSSENTAMSHASKLSDITTNTVASQKLSLKSLPQAPSTRASKIRASIKCNEKPMQQVNTTGRHSSVDASLISDLESSRAEVEDMKQKLAKLEDSNQNHQEKLTQQAENHKRELFNRQNSK